MPSVGSWSPITAPWPGQVAVRLDPQRLRAEARHSTRTPPVMRGGGAGMTAWAGGWKLVEKTTSRAPSGTRSPGLENLRDAAVEGLLPAVPTGANPAARCRRPGVLQRQLSDRREHSCQSPWTRS